MTRRISFIIALVVLCLAPNVSKGQTVAATNSSVAQAGHYTCEDNYGAVGAYPHCVLRNENNQLLRGNQREVLGQFRPLHPLPLERNVIGDEAKHYARIYYRTEMTRETFKYVGAFLVAVAIVGNQPCSAPICHHSSGYVRNSAIAGGSLLALSIPFRIWGARARDRALELSNANLAK